MMISAPTTAQRLAACDRPHGHPVMRQRWNGLLFLHWPVEPEIIQARLPDGLFVDTYDGQAWLGVVPFFMDRVRPVLLPPVPGVSWFLELNVRTYVHDAEGRPGVWFFSLDCNQPLAVEIARRFFHLPYEHATMQAKFTGNQIDYHSRRNSRDAMETHYHYQRPTSAQPAIEGSLEWFLVERYLLFSSGSNGSLFCGKVHHAPYEISLAHCDHWSTEPLRLNGFSAPSGPPPSMLVAQTVDVRIFPLRKIPTNSVQTTDLKLLSD